MAYEYGVVDSRRPINIPKLFYIAFLEFHSALMI